MMTVTMNDDDDDDKHFKRKLIIQIRFFRTIFHEVPFIKQIYI